MNTEQLKTDKPAIEILKFRMVERLKIYQPSWTEEFCSKKVDDFLDEEDPNLGECFTTAMQDFASQESKRAVDEFKEQLAKKAELDQFLEVNQKLVYTECQKAVSEFKEKLKDEARQRGFSETDHNGKILFDLIDKL